MFVCVHVCMCIHGYMLKGCVMAPDGVLLKHDFSSAVCVALGREAALVQLSSNTPSIPTRTHTPHTCAHT